MKDNDRATDKVAQELEKAIDDTYHLVAECLETLNAKAVSLIRDIESGRLTKTEIDARQAEINALRRHVEHVRNMALNAEKKLDEYNKKTLQPHKKSN